MRPVAVGRAESGKSSTASTFVTRNPSAPSCVVMRRNFVPDGPDEIGPDVIFVGNIFFAGVAERDAGGLDRHRARGADAHLTKSFSSIWISILYRSFK